MSLNLAAEQGRTLAEAYMFELAPGLGREAAHDLVYQAATVSKARGIDLRAALQAEVSDPKAVREIGPAEYLGQTRDDVARAVADWRDRPHG
jgi:3-carboxy-cis,cis-muconate cycloisomerase